MAEHKEHKPKQKTQPNLKQINDGAVRMGNVQFEDNRQTSIVELQTSANKSSQVQNMTQLQKMANRFTSVSKGPNSLPINFNENRIIQRMVWPIGRDETSESNYDKLVEKDEHLIDTTGSLRAPDKEVSPFDNLGEAEALHLVGHGDGNGHIEGMTASELLNYLIDLGLTPKHTGAIRLVSCLSGTPRPRARLFTEEFKEVLEARGFVNGVIGFNGLVRVVKGAKIEVIAPKNIPKFDELSPQLEAINGATIKFSIPPNYDPKTPEWQEWNKRLVDLRAEAKKLTVQIIWEGQQLDKNISYFPPGIHLQEQHQKDKLGGLTLIPGEEARDIPVDKSNDRTGVMEERNL